MKFSYCAYFKNQRPCNRNLNTTYKEPLFFLCLFFELLSGFFSKRLTNLQTIDIAFSWLLSWKVSSIAEDKHSQHMSKRRLGWNRPQCLLPEETMPSPKGEKQPRVLSSYDICDQYGIIILGVKYCHTWQ